jgi:acyl-CoA thioesterase-1
MFTRSSFAVAIVLAGAALLALGGCARSSHAATPLLTHTNSGTARPVVVAIGDSIMKGHGLPASDAWPALLAAANGWQLDNLACDGAGFLQAGDTDDCGSVFNGLLAEAVAKHPDVVLISGSSNDLGGDNSALAAETDSVVTTLRTDLPKATIVGVSTVWNDTATPDQMDDINEQVRAAIASVGGSYFDIGQPLAGHRDWLQKDDVHPTSHGQRVLAKAIAGAIRGAKLTF